MNSNAYWELHYKAVWPNVIKKRDSKRIRKLKLKRQETLNYYEWFSSGIPWVSEDELFGEEI